MRKKIPVINWIIILLFLFFGICMIVLSYVFKQNCNYYGASWLSRMGVICIAVSIFTYIISYLIIKTDNSTKDDKTQIFVHKNTDTWHREIDYSDRRHKRHIKKGQNIQVYGTTDNPWITIPVTIAVSVFFLLLGILAAAISPFLGIFWSICILSFLIHQIKCIVRRQKQKHDKNIH